MIGMEKSTSHTALMAALFFFIGLTVGFLFAPVRQGIQVKVCNNGNQAPREGKKA